MNDNGELKFSVIGAGAMGINHVRVLSQNRHVNLVGVADAKQEALDAVKERYNVPVYTRFDELLKQDLDAVVIAVPTSLHKDMALPVINSKRHVLIEKPIAKNLDEAQQIVDASEKNKVKLMVGHIERFNPIIPAIKEAVHDEKIVSIHITRIGPFPPRVKDVGVVIDLAVHDIDLIRFLTESEFMDINCYINNSLSDLEDTTMITFRMANGAMANITTNWITPFKRRIIQIATPEKLVEGDFIAMQAKEYSGFKQENESYVVNTLRTRIGEPLRFELEAFIDSIRNDTSPPITGEDGLMALSIAMECLKNGHK